MLITVDAATPALLGSAAEPLVANPCRSMLTLNKGLDQQQFQLF
jgi:hypothetical protein